MEYFDILDENGQSGDRKATREEAHEQGLWHKTVHIWVLNDENKILLQKRALDRLSHPGKWDIAIGGHINAGEISLDTAVREAKEELGIITKPEEFKYLFTIRGQSIQNNNTYINNEFSDVYLLRKNIKTNDFKTPTLEVTAIKYVSVEEMKKMMVEDNKTIVNHWSEFEKLLKYIKSQ